MRFLIVSFSVMLLTLYADDHQECWIDLIKGEWEYRDSANQILYPRKHQSFKEGERIFMQKGSEAEIQDEKGSQAQLGEMSILINRKSSSSYRHDYQLVKGILRFDFKTAFRITTPSASVEATRGKGEIIVKNGKTLFTHKMGPDALVKSSHSIKKISPKQKAYISATGKLKGG